MKLFFELKQPWARFLQWIVRHRKRLLIIGVIIVSIAAIITYALVSQKPAPAAQKTVQKVTAKPKPIPPVVYYSPLTGSIVKTQSATTGPVTGIMIENSPDARPQSGLKNSGVVFEAIAEGGITRFMVLYQTEKPQMIGPVRSLRLYDVDWLAAFNTGIGHVGGSLYALNEIRNGNYRDLDQFFNPGTYWRASDRYAPHNVYTSFDNLDALNKAKGFTSSKFTGFTRVNGKPTAKPTATDINVTISSFLYNSEYIYNAKTNTYARFQAGEPHMDREDGQITPSVVIAMRVNESTVLQDGYRESIDTIGKGNATIFQNGVAISATWHKTSKASQITFTDAAGKDIPLVRGQTWISAVSNDGGDVTWK